MPTLQISLPAPHDAQRKVLADAGRFNVLACGRRWGKSTLGIDRIVKPALERFPTAWFSPSYKMLLESWRGLQDVLAPVITDRNNAEYRIELRGGGSVVMFSLDGDVADSVRGRAFKAVVIDEAAMVRSLRTTWETVLRPTLADYRGSAWFLSTPRGMNDFRGFYDRGQDPERDDWRSWQMPTGSNPHIAAEEIEAARLEMAEASFCQEFLAQFVNWEGAVFRRILEAATAQRKDGPEPGHEYVIGADWGRSVDFTVLTVVDTTARAMVDMDRSNKVDYAVQRNRLLALYEKWRPSKIIAEANSIGQPIIEQLQRDGLPVMPFTTTNATKAAIIEALALSFEQGSISILNDPVLLGELQAYAAEQLPGGMLRYGAPQGQHDDTVMSLAIAWSVLRGDRSMYPATASYDDASRPRGLLSQHGHSENLIVIVRSAMNEPIFAHFLGDANGLFVERDFYGEIGMTDAQIVDGLLNGFGAAWPGFGKDDPRRWPGVIVGAEEQALAAQLRAKNIWTLSAAEGDEDAVRQVAALFSQQKMRIHERCGRTIQCLKLRSWDDAVADKKRADPFVALVATRSQLWRLLV